MQQQQCLPLVFVFLVPGQLAQILSGLRYFLQWVPGARIVSRLECADNTIVSDYLAQRSNKAMPSETERRT